jgi:hypothetical protein
MIRNQAHSKDPEFYVFLKKLDKLQSILGDKTTLLLSSHRAIFDLLFEPPQPGNTAQPGRVAGAESATPSRGKASDAGQTKPPTATGSASKGPVKGGG